MRREWWTPLWAAALFAAGFLAAKFSSAPGVAAVGDGASSAVLAPQRDCPTPPPARRRAPARAVVSASLEDDTVWMLQQIPELCVIPYSHVDKPARTHAWEAVPNRGREASVFLQFIVDHYDNLPDRTVFLHGHYAPGWHSVAIAEILRHLDWSLHYANVNWNPETSMWSEAADEPGTGMHAMWQSLDKHWPELWAEATGLPTAPARLRFHCCAQFMVSRQLLRRHPRAWYQKALAWVHGGEARFGGDVAQAAIMMEFTWEYILRPGFAGYRHCAEDGRPADCDICAVVHGCVNGTGFDRLVAGNFRFDRAEHDRLRSSYPCGPWD